MTDYEPKHRAATGSSTQEQNPWRTVLRTVIQVGPVAVFALLVVLPPVLNDVLVTFGEQLPPGIYTVLAATAGALTLIAAITARVMAHPKVNELLRKYAPAAAPEKK